MPATLLRDLAKLVNGSVVGDETTRIVGAAALNRVAAGQITLADDPRLAKRMDTTSAAAVVVRRGFPATNVAQLVVDDVHAAFTKIVTHFRPPREHHSIGISPMASVAPSARLAENVDVYPHAMIGDDVVIGAGSVIHSGVTIMPGCHIGRDVTLMPNVVLYENTVVGDRSLIHAGAVIGADGFGYQTIDGRHQRAAQLGNVVIGADVEIGAGTTIDRGTYDSTTIGEGTKIDNQVMIGHNCQIGRHNLLCSQVGIAGSCTTGDYVVMAGQVGLSDHLRIGDRAVLGAKAGVMHDIPSDSVFIGVPATPEREQWKMWVHVRQLPKMQRQIKHLVQQVEHLLGRMERERAREAA